MARCKNDIVLDKIGINQLKDYTEVTFSVLDNLPDCRNINTKNFSDVSEGYSYNRFNRPDNHYECNREGCITTGTLTIPEDGYATYFARYDAAEFAAGVITFYVNVGSADSVSGTLSIGDEELANADVYKFTVSDADDSGFAAVTIDLSKACDSIEGDGWKPDTLGAYIKITVESEAGISSISIYDSLDEFEVNDTIKLGCISSIEGDDEIEAAETTCLTSGYDTSSLSFERTITAKKMTPNYWKLNPMMAKGDTTEYGVPETVEKVIEEADGYGVVTILDVFQEECRFIGVQIPDCNVTDSQLTRLSMDTLIEMDEDNYIVVPKSDGTTYIYFNKSLVGRTARITYPKTTEVEEYVASESNIGERRVSMAYPVKQTDDIEVLWVFNNVLITSFPQSIQSEDENEFEFTVNIQQDSDGHYYHEYVIRS